MTPNQRTRALSALLPDDPEGLPVGRLARRLLAEAEASPALIARAAAAPAIATPRESQPFAAMALLSDPALDVRQYLEDLASIAITSAQQAEDLAVQAQAASRKARRGMLVLAGFAMMGLLVGVAGFAVSRSSNVRLAEIRDEMGAMHDMQRQAQDQIADIAAQTAEQRNAIEQHDAVDVQPSMGTAPAMATVIAQPPPTAAPPARQPAPATYYYQPWPNSRPAVRRAPLVRSQATPPVVVPRFFADIQRSVRGIFR